MTPRPMVLSGEWDPHGRRRTAHSAPMMKNGPNGTYVFRPIRRAARSTARTTPARRSAKIAQASARSPPASSPTPMSSLTSPSPNAPAPNGMDGRYRTAGMASAAATASQDLRSDERVAAADRVDQRDRDDRQGQHVGQQPLVQVGGQADDQRDEPGAEDRHGERVATEPEHEQPEGERADQARRPRSASRRRGPPGAPRRAPASAPRAGRPRSRARTRRHRADRPAAPSARVPSVAVVSRRSGGPGAGERELDQRGVRDAGRALGRIGVVLWK